jgi:UDP-N-acetylglucosamine--N-acetylmuramyl-(pentapeptide) pyrophosphoryl-undecaprenol N-acetylglucosamine transferase
MVFRPRFILGVGGYSSGPVVLTAVLLKKMRLLSVQIAILEQNSVFGFVNRLLSSKVDRIFLSFPILSQKNFDFSVPTIVTGNPIRASMKTLPPACVDPFCIFIFGGSQGSVGLNTLVLESLPYLVKFKSQLQFIHQTGEKDYERVLLEYQKTEFKYEMKKFIQDMALTYLKSSLLICRAGSSTLSELAAVGRAAILIPLPTASDNHQEMNARVFFNENAAELLIQNEATGKMLAERIIGLMKNSEKLHAIEQKVQTLNKPEAGEKILEELCLMALKST